MTRPVLALTGPTASGKTALAVRLATRGLATRGLAGRVPIEVISVDSAQVYRGMDAATAKPDAATRALVPHHLIDVREPWETYSAADFLRDAERLVREIRARGAEPLFVGGTMLYFLALTRGLFPAPPPPAEMRAGLARLDRAALEARLARTDPDGAREMRGAPLRRLRRAVEIVETVGPLKAARAATRPASFPVELFALLPPREVLFERIAARTREIFERGLLDEVRSLRANGYTPDLPSQRAIGYREAHAVLDGAIDEAEARRRVEVATRRYAKRQRTWLRNTLAHRPLPSDDLERAEEILAERLSRSLESGR